MATSTPTPQPMPGEERPTDEVRAQKSPADEQPITEAADLEMPTERAAQESVATAMPLTPHEWNSAQEEEWSEHSATAWTLAHIIHHIYSTPLPPMLPAEQRPHFEQVIRQAAALMEAWQSREREQAQALAAERPPDAALVETAAAEMVGGEELPLPKRYVL